LATDDATPNGNGRKMIPRTLQRVAGQLRRTFRWRLWALASASLILLACAESSFGPRKSLPDQQSNESPKLAVSIQNAGLKFIPSVGSRLELQGEATIGSWSSRSTDIHGEVVLDTDAAALNTLFDRIESVAPHDEGHIQSDLLTLSFRSPPVGDITVPVMSLHGDSNAMDRDMQNALDVRQHPLIEYVFQHLQQAALQWNSQDHQAELKLSIVGRLSMAGVGRPITMDMIVKRDSRRHFLAHAQTALLMTDFSMTPPGALFGLIKADDRVVVVFDLDFVLADHLTGR
jgi:YceI-like domain